MGKPSKASSCTGKVPFRTRREAQDVSRRVARKGGSHRLKAYHCTYCGAWHLGHPTPGRKGRRR